MKKILVIAPHPDDETLGCGGTLLKHKEEKDQVHWLIITKLDTRVSKEKYKIRSKEIKKVGNYYNFNSVIEGDFVTALIDTYPQIDIIEFISNSIDKIKPDIIYIPFSHDVHSDHRIINESIVSACKTFRKPYIKSIRAYETLSETEFDINTSSIFFKPNLFINIDKYLETKIKIMKIYKSEFSAHPFPRSEKSIKSLAYLRGNTANLNAAEAFIILKDIIE